MLDRRHSLLLMQQQRSRNEISQSGVSRRAQGRTRVLHNTNTHNNKPQTRRKSANTSQPQCVGRRDKLSAAARASHPIPLQHCRTTTDLKFHKTTTTAIDTDDSLAYSSRKLVISENPDNRTMSEEQENGSRPGTDVKVDLIGADETNISLFPRVDTDTMLEDSLHVSQDEKDGFSKEKSCGTEPTHVGGRLLRRSLRLESPLIRSKSLSIDPVSGENALPNKRRRTLGRDAAGNSVVSLRRSSKRANAESPVNQSHSSQLGIRESPLVLMEGLAQAGSMDLTDHDRFIRATVDKEGEDKEYLPDEESATDSSYRSVEQARGQIQYNTRCRVANNTNGKDVVDRITRRRTRQTCTDEQDECESSLSTNRSRSKRQENRPKSSRDTCSFTKGLEVSTRVSESRSRPLRLANEGNEVELSTNRVHHSHSARLCKIHGEKRNATFILERKVGRLSQRRVNDETADQPTEKRQHKRKFSHTKASSDKLCDQDLRHRRNRLSLQAPPPQDSQLFPSLHGIRSTLNHGDGETSENKIRKDHHVIGSWSMNEELIHRRCDSPRRPKRSFHGECIGGPTGTVAPLVLRARERKAPAHLQDYVCVNSRKRDKDQFETTQTTSPRHCLRSRDTLLCQSRHSRLSSMPAVSITHAAAKFQRNTKQVNPSSRRDSLNYVPKNSQPKLDSTNSDWIKDRKVWAENRCRPRRTLHLGSLLDYKQLTDQYADMASKHLVKSIRFGPTFQSTCDVVDRVIRLYEAKACSTVDPEVLEDEKLYRKCLKSHKSYEAQEKLIILEEERIVLGNEQDTEGTVKLKAALADLPIVLSNQVRIRSRSAQCRNCQLCRESTFILPVSTLTPGITRVDDFELDDEIDQNTLEALKRLRASLVFLKQYNNG